MIQRHIIHLDMDAFYASVEMLDDHSLRGKPVIVGGRSSRGVVSAASYEARKFGVRSALPIATAKKRCPQGIFLIPRMTRYQEISREIMAIFKRYTPLVEPISLDEAFLDVSESQKLFGAPDRIAANIRQVVKDETLLTISAGVATSKLVAKIASDINKPDGLTVVLPGSEKSFLAPLDINKLWGVGKTTIQQLTIFGVQTIGDLSIIPLELLEQKLGKKHGLHLHLASNAVDVREVEPERTVKSIGHEDTFSTDLLDLEEIREKLLNLAVRVGERVRRNRMVGRTVTIKVKYYDFSQVTRSVTLKKATSDNMQIYREGLTLLKKTSAGKKAMRLLGIYLSNLHHSDAPHQSSLFDSEEQLNKKQKLYEAIDNINEKFKDTPAKRAIKPGRLI